MKEIKNLFCHGSSLSAGGGLYDTHIKEQYKKSCWNVGERKRW